MDPHRIEVMDSIRKMQGTPLKEQVMCANGNVSYQDDKDTARTAT